MTVLDYGITRVLKVDAEDGDTSVDVLVYMNRRGCLPCTEESVRVQFRDSRRPVPVTRAQLVAIRTVELRAELAVMWPFVPCIVRRLHGFDEEPTAPADLPPLPDEDEIAAMALARLEPAGGCSMRLNLE